MNHLSVVNLCRDYDVQLVKPLNSSMPWLIREDSHPIAVKRGTNVTLQL